MLVSSIRRNGKAILKDVFPIVLKSPDPDLWKRAINFMVHRIALMESTLQEVCASDDSSALNLIRNLHEWKSAHQQCCSLYGQKFIVPTMTARLSRNPSIAN